MEIGGGFGGKIVVYEQPVAVLLAKKSGRPVKVTMNRAGVFEGTGPTPGSYIRVKLGADKTGKLVAGEAYLAYEAGGYPGSPIACGCMCIFSCYDIPNAKVEGYDVCVNKPRSAAYRAPGSTNAAFAVEQVFEEVAAKLGICSLEMRIKNAAREGTRGSMDRFIRRWAGRVPRSSEEQRPLEVEAVRPEPRARRGLWLLVQCWV